jgi:dienelactone hydrolase
MRTVCGILLAFYVLAAPVRAFEPTPLAGTQPLTMTGDIPAQMRAGIDKFVTRETERSIGERAKLWKRDLSSMEAYEKSVAPNRQRFRTMIGIVDPRLPLKDLDLVGSTSTPVKLGETDDFSILAVRWNVLEGVHGEGLYLVPKSGIGAGVVVLPDADQTPEMLAGMVKGLKPESQIARRLAEGGVEVLIPVLIDRKDDLSGHPDVWFTNIPHREWISRPAFELGRTVIGYEVQKTLVAIDWFRWRFKGKVGVAGYGEGGLIALYAAAVDGKVPATLVSGYFGPREALWEEPVYRNVFGLLTEFGDAEIASLSRLNSLVVEYSEGPKVDGPPPVRDGRQEKGAPGKIRTPAFESVKAEFARLEGFFPKGDGAAKSDAELIVGANGAAVEFGSDAALAAFAKRLGGLRDDVPLSGVSEAKWATPDATARQHRQVKELVDHTQLLLARSEKTRAAFWKDADATSVETWQASGAKYRDYFWDEIIGRFPKASEPVHPRSRKIIDDPKFTGYEVALDVWPDVFCYGVLLVPKDIKPGERRPVVVCQHGLEGVPMDVVTTDPNVPGFNYYHGFATRLAERGFITYAPHNFYRGGNEFRQLQRKLQPLKKSMYSIIVAQHERHLEWLATLPFVDAKRVGFYGLSYGGFSAIRIPPLLVDGYALSISSGEFSDMARKSVSTTDSYSYPFHGSYEVFEWDLASKFGYGDLAGLMVPRPFMVERGHDDGVSPDEWVAAEYAKVRRRYDKLGLGDKTEIEFFNGGHEIHSVGTFKFLHKHLGWPEPENK